MEYIPTRSFEDAIDELTCHLLKGFHAESRRVSTTRSEFRSSCHTKKRSKLSASGAHKSRFDADGTRSQSYQSQNLKDTGSLACPFYIENKHRYRACLTKNEYLSIEDVKQHLYMEHRQPISCPICHGHFASYDLRNHHLRTRDHCHPKDLPAAAGLTEQQVDDMSAVSDLSQPQEDAWFELWKVIFPDTRPPASPFYSDKQGLIVTSLRDFWTRRGQSIVADVMAQRNLRQYEIQDEERNLEWLYNTALNKAVEKTFNSLQELPPAAQG